ncbi:MAG: ATP-binding cassette domain-containing protein [Rhodospirillales bacterium]|nr:ATP-binding cassette domain-containing protein [Rhodospirillales bacterium]
MADTALAETDTGAAAGHLPIARLVARLARLIGSQGPSAWLVGFGIVVEMAFASALPFSLKFIIDDGLIRGDHRLLIAIVIALAVGGLAVSVIGLARDFVFARLAAAALGQLRARLFAHLQRLSLDFYGRSRSGDVLGRFSNDLASVETALINAIPWGVLPALDVIANTGLLFLLDWRLALVAVLAWPFCLLAPRIFARRAVAASYHRKQEEGALLAVVQENVQAQPLVKALNLQGEATRQFDGHNVRLMARARRVGFLSAMVERSAGLGIMLLQVLVLAIGAWMAAIDMMTIGTLTAFLALFLNASLSLAYTTQFVPTLVHAAGGIAVAPSVTDRPGAVDLPPLVHAIAFENVSFGYAESELILRGVSVAIPATASVAFVGASGSGKSTILSLLMRLHEPSSGRITFDGMDLRAASQHSLRRQIGVVFQDSFLLNTTVAENIRLGRLDATPAEIEAAAREAEIHEVIVQLPEGYDTLIGEHGGRLSGGQRQRVAIARALVRDPRILILDEATSALDPGTETAINATLARIGHGRMVVAVTHRLASVVDADGIHVLDRGGIVESGRHRDLLAQNGHYARLWAKQSGFQVSQDGLAAAVTPARLRHVPLFDQLDDATLDLAAPLFVTEFHPQRRMVIQQGDDGDRFYVLVRGAVEVLVSQSGEAPRRVGILEDGDHFGEMALLRSAPRMATIRTLMPCTLLSLQRRQFEVLLQHAPQLRARMEAVHCARLATLSTA